jgi:hypothetical protein
MAHLPQTPYWLTAGPSNSPTNLQPFLKNETEFMKKYLMLFGSLFLASSSAHANWSCDESFVYNGQDQLSTPLINNYIAPTNPEKNPELSEPWRFKSDAVELPKILNERGKPYSVSFRGKTTRNGLELTILKACDGDWGCKDVLAQVSTDGTKLQVEAAGFIDSQAPLATASSVVVTCTRLPDAI